MAEHLTLPRVDVYIILRVNKFPSECLPDWLDSFANELSVSTQTPKDLAGGMALAALAVACQKKFVVTPRRGWDEPTNLYIVGLMDPANRKSAVLSKIAEPMRVWERNEGERLGPTIRAARSRCEMLTKQRQDLISSAVKTKDDSERQHFLSQVGNIDDELAANPVPSEPRLLCDDITPENLCTKMSQNGAKMGILTPEGDLFDIMAGLYTKGGQANLGILLKAHSGDDHRVDRGSRSPENLIKPALTIGCCAQREVAQGLLSNKRFRGRGVLGRIIFLMPESRLGSREINPPEMNPVTESTYSNLMHTLLNLQAERNADGSFIATKLGFDSDASALFSVFRTRIERDLAEFGRLCTLSDWAGKLAGQVARVAALLHIGDHADQRIPATISFKVVERAILIGDYFIEHALAVFHLMGADKSSELARLIVRALQRHGMGEFSRRDLHQLVRRHVEKPDDLDLKPVYPAWFCPDSARR